MQTQVLHITPHMGGGVGRVLKALTARSADTLKFRHRINCLDFANAAALEWSADSGIPVAGKLAEDRDQLALNIQAADIVHLHWWNHPLTYQFLASDAWPAFRCVVWSHVNGHQAPHRIPTKLLEFGDRFVLGTPYSQSIDTLASYSEAWRRKKLRTVFASAGFEHVAHVQTQPHTGFHVGYVGTVDYCKMHPAYLQMHAAAKIPEARYVICGGSRDDDLRREASRLDCAHQFDIRGQVSNVPEVLSQLDVFGYPLQPRHYGASEVAIIEAMAAGVVPIVLGNGCESFIVKDGRTGLVAKNPAQFTEALQYLYRHPETRRNFAVQGRRDVAARFHVSRTVDAWHSIYDEVFRLPKAKRQLAVESQNRQVDGFDLFTCGLADASETPLLRSAAQQPDRGQLGRLAQLDPIFRGKSNGSAFQYARFFPEDRRLQTLCRSIESAEESSAKAAA